jgi:signal-transduction protein with cAMP-binding, CBS, and nucleotidyltransferase domain
MLRAQVMEREAARCPESLSVEACARMMRDDNVGFLCVADVEERVLGVVTDRDLAVRVLAGGLSPQTPVGQVMTRVVRICRPNDELAEAEWKMSAMRDSPLVPLQVGLP